ncbi:MAG TPA: M48 family metallopeptidase [Anaerolineaceae bacterium]
MTPGFPTLQAPRTFKVLLFLFGIYGLALVLIFFLLFTGIINLAKGDPFNIIIAIGCLFSVAIILYSLFPPFDKFQPPGIKMTSKEAPRLFNEIHQTAALLGQTLPENLYLLLDFDTYIIRRGGILGIGSHRIAAIGVPLLAALNVAQFRAIFAHELAHYKKTQAPLSPLVYTLRLICIHTLSRIDVHDWKKSPLRYVLKTFVKMSQPIAEYQELVADQAAAGISGVQVFSKAMGIIYGAMTAFQAYMQQEFFTVIEAGYRPPLFDGFAQYLRTPAVSTVMEHLVSRSMLEKSRDPFDAHASLMDRLNAIAPFTSQHQEDDRSTPAIDLLDHLPDLERKLLEFQYGKKALQTWKPIPWEGVGRSVYLPVWKSTLRKIGEGLQGVTPETIPDLLNNPDPLWVLLKGGSSAPMSKEELRGGVINITGMALATALADRGWQIITPPGDLITLQLGDDVIQPFAVVSRLAAGVLSPFEWQRICRETGITGIPLGTTGTNSTRV